MNIIYEFTKKGLFTKKYHSSIIFWIVTFVEGVHISQNKPFFFSFGSYGPLQPNKLYHTSLLSKIWDLVNRIPWTTKWWLSLKLAWVDTNLSTQNVHISIAGIVDLFSAPGVHYWTDSSMDQLKEALVCILVREVITLNLLYIERSQYCTLPQNGCLC